MLKVLQIIIKIQNPKFKDLSSIKNLMWYRLCKNKGAYKIKKKKSFRTSEKGRSFNSTFKVSRFRFRQYQSLGLIPLKKK